MQIHLPKELKPFERHLKLFVDLMVQKLYLNRHKGFAEGADLKNVLKLLAAELLEVEEALRHKSQFEVAIEACDTANMSFILFLVTMKLNRMEFDEQRKPNW
jgi:hypothetical protein